MCSFVTRVSSGTVATAVCLARPTEAVVPGGNEYQLVLQRADSTPLRVQVNSRPKTRSRSNR
jgi:hypothetical protein